MVRNSTRPGKHGLISTANGYFESLGPRPNGTNDADRFIDRAAAEHVAVNGIAYSTNRADITLRPGVMAAHVIDLLDTFGAEIKHSSYDKEQRKIITVAL